MSESAAGRAAGSPETALPPEVVRAIAAFVHATPTYARDIGDLVVRGLRKAGWLVEPELKAGMVLRGALRQRDHLLLAWPVEMRRPFFDGEPGSYTIAPWSVKLTPSASDVPREIMHAAECVCDEGVVPPTYRAEADRLYRWLAARAAPQSPTKAEKSTSPRIPKLGEMVLIRYAGEDCVGLVVGRSELPDCPDSLNLMFFVPHADTQKRAWNVRRPHWRWPDEPLASNPA